MAPPPEYDKEPKAPDKSATNISCEEPKTLHNLVNEQQTNSDNKLANTTACGDGENKHVETLDDGQLRALLDEAITYKCPKDREGKSSLFKELLEEVEQDEQACEAAARGSTSRARRQGRGRRALPHSNSLQDLVAALAAEPAPRRVRHQHQQPHAPVSARAIHGGSLPSGVDTSFLLSEEPPRAGYLATVRCVNPPPLAERRVSASDANCPAEVELLNRRSKPVFPMTYTARATLEIGSGAVCSGRALTTTTSSNQVRTRAPSTYPWSHHHANRASYHLDDHTHHPFRTSQMQRNQLRPHQYTNRAGYNDTHLPANRANHDYQTSHASNRVRGNNQFQASNRARNNLGDQTFHASNRAGMMHFDDDFSYYSVNSRHRELDLDIDQISPGRSHKAIENRDDFDGFYRQGQDDFVHHSLTSSYQDWLIDFDEEDDDFRYAPVTVGPPERLYNKPKLFGSKKTIFKPGKFVSIDPSQNFKETSIKPIQKNVQENLVQKNIPKKNSKSELQKDRKIEKPEPQEENVLATALSIAKKAKLPIVKEKIDINQMKLLCALMICDTDGDDDESATGGGIVDDSKTTEIRIDNEKPRGPSEKTDRKVNQENVSKKEMSGHPREPSEKPDRKKLNQENMSKKEVSKEKVVYNEKLRGPSGKTNRKLNQENMSKKKVSKEKVETKSKVVYDEKPRGPSDKTNTKINQENVSKKEVSRDKVEPISIVVYNEKPRGASEKYNTKVNQENVSKKEVSEKKVEPIAKEPEGSGLTAQSQIWMENVNNWYENLDIYINPISRPLENFEAPLNERVEKFDTPEEPFNIFARNIASDQNVYKNLEPISNFNSSIPFPFVSSSHMKRNYKNNTESKRQNTYLQDVYSNSIFSQHEVQKNLASFCDFESDINDNDLYILRKEYRERVGSLELPSLSVNNPRNIRKMTIGKPLPNLNEKSERNNKEQPNRKSDSSDRKSDNDKPDRKSDDKSGRKSDGDKSDKKSGDYEPDRKSNNGKPIMKPIDDRKSDDNKPNMIRDDYKSDKVKPDRKSDNDKHDKKSDKDKSDTKDDEGKSSMKPDNDDDTHDRESDDIEPKKKSDNDKPGKNGDNDKTDKESDDAKPNTKPDGDKLDRKSDDDKPGGESGDDHPDRKSDDDKPDRNSDDDKSDRQSDDDKPDRNSDADKSDKKSDDDKPGRKSGSDQPDRKSADDEPDNYDEKSDEYEPDQKSDGDKFYRTNDNKAEDKSNEKDDGKSDEKSPKHYKDKNKQSNKDVKSKGNSDESGCDSKEDRKTNRNNKTNRNAIDDIFSCGFDRNKSIRRIDEENNTFDEKKPNTCQDSNRDLYRIDEENNTFNEKKPNTCQDSNRDLYEYKIHRNLNEDESNNNSFEDLTNQNLAENKIKLNCNSECFSKQDEVISERDHSIRKAEDESIYNSLVEKSTHSDEEKSIGNSDIDIPTRSCEEYRSDEQQLDRSTSESDQRCECNSEQNKAGKDLFNNTNIDNSSNRISDKDKAIFNSDKGSHAHLRVEDKNSKIYDRNNDDKAIFKSDDSKCDQLSGENEPGMKSYDDKIYNYNLLNKICDNVSDTSNKNSLQISNTPDNPEPQIILKMNKIVKENSKMILAMLPNNAYILTFPNRFITPHNAILPNDNSAHGVSAKTKHEGLETMKKNAFKMLLFKNLFRSDSEIETPVVKPAVKEVDSAIPFSCITTPEVVASCNTTSSTSQAAVVVDPKPLQLVSSYRAVARLVGAPYEDEATSSRHQPDPRSVISSSFNGLPLSRPNYGSTASSAPDEYKKSLDENGNSVQGFSSPLSGSSQHKKPRRKKSSKNNETVIKSHQIDGYQGNKDLNEVLRFIESNADNGRAHKLGRAKHKDDSDDKGKKRSTERRKEESKIKRATSMEELSRTKLEDLTDKPAKKERNEAKAERRSWGEDARESFYYEPAEIPTEADFQTVTKKRRPRRRADEPPRAPRPPSPRARRVSAPPSDRSNDSNDDLDSVHSLPADVAPARPPHAPASYADIARTRHNIPDLIESCNFYLEQREAAAASAAPGDADGYPALEPRAPPARRTPPARDTKPAASPLQCTRDRKERSESSVEAEGPAPDVVSDRRPPVILLDSTQPRDMDGITFGFDINEQLLGGTSQRPRCDLVRSALEGSAAAAGDAVAVAVADAVAIRAGCAAIRYVPPDAPPDDHHLHLIVDYVTAAWEDVVRCGGGKVRYYSE